VIRPIEVATTGRDPVVAAEAGDRGSVPMQIRSARGFSLRVSDGTRTRDRLDHNQELYRLSYAHRGASARQRTGATPGI
jgi:hypothetical protein